jgi:hypothetical protein
MHKFLSRKFLMALLSVIIGVLTMLNVEDGLIQIISSIGLIIVPTLVYIGVEGTIDIKRVLQDGIEITRLLEELRNAEPMVVELELEDDEHSEGTA